MIRAIRRACRWLRDHLYELHTEAGVNCAPSGLVKLAAERDGISERALMGAVSKIVTVRRLAGGKTCWTLDDDVALWLGEFDD